MKTTVARVQPGFVAYRLGNLFATESNMRKNRTPDEVRSMALSIAAHGGLLQNLVVVPEQDAKGRRTGRAGVAAGETRRLALELLRDGGVQGVDGYDDDYEVWTKEVPDEESAAASATENIRRTQPHPADQFEAFRTLFDQCGSTEAVAEFFGVPELMVRQRLKLANVEPSLFKLYRDGGIKLEQLMALAITDDHSAQLRVWRAARVNSWATQPDQLRRALTESEADISSPSVKFVGLERYEAEGGRVRRDLFGGPDDGTVMDADLLHRLACEKLEKAAASVRKEGWGWVEVHAARFTDAHQYTRAQKTQRALNDTEQAQLQALKSQVSGADKALSAHYDESDDEGADFRGTASTLSNALSGAREQLRKLETEFEVWAPEVLARAGAVVAIGSAGKVEIIRALVRPEDRKALAKATRPAEPAQGTESNAADAERPAESEALNRRLTSHRTVALQRMVADNTQVALAALAHNLVQRLLLDSVRTCTALDVQARGCEGQLNTYTSTSVQQARAFAELQDLRTQWGERIPGDSDALLPWLLKLPMQELCDLLALCSALTINYVSSTGGVHQADKLAEAVQLDMSDWWEPSGDEYLSLVPKAQIAQALTDAAMPAEGVAIGKLKKAEAVGKAETLLAGKRWLPKTLRRTG